MELNIFKKKLFLLSGNEVLLTLWKVVSGGFSFTEDGQTTAKISFLEVRSVFVIYRGH